MRKFSYYIVTAVTVLSLVGIMLMVTQPYNSAHRRAVLYMATTTSLKDTGLLDVLILDFEKWSASKGYSIEVRYTAVGSGQALRMAERGDVDVVLVHAPSLEREHLDKGVIKCRNVIAYNFFTLIGPKEDPAGIRGFTAIEEFMKVAEAKASFVSRGDNSSTYFFELALWSKAIGRKPDPGADTWYISAGAGMGLTLLLANEKNAYVLSDTGTWLRYRSRVQNLDVLVTAAPDLINVYSFGIVKVSDASRLMAQYINTRGLEVMATLTVDGNPIFTPVERANAELMQWLNSTMFGPSCV
jgi:tungstate transport system substrate-binding protein